MPATSESGKLLEIFFAIFEPDDHITHDFYSNLRQIAEHYIQADIIRYNGIYRHEMAHPAFCITGNKILQEGFLTNSP